MPRRVSAGLVVLAVGLASPPPARACAPAPPPGLRVDIADEEALIVWNPATRVQHFVRRATFRSTAADFGFLVPTPARPSLAEADDAVFGALARAILPEVVRREQWEFEPIPLLFGPYFLSRAPREGRLAAVRVLETKRVAGYDAAVLQADDAPALLGWLRSHGYEGRPELLDWLKPYVDLKWTITAFKVAGREGTGGDVATSAVRMSFETARPFFPYREPVDQRSGADSPRMLRVFAVAPSRLEGRVGVDGAWPGRLRYASPRADLGTLVAGAVPSPSDVPGTPWLLAWEDVSAPRPGTDDLFFSPAANQARLVPPPVEVVDRRTFLVPVDVLLLAALWLIWRFAKRRRASRA